ncbi:MAG: 2-oxoacid:acceptor oxidoreductase family protein, partial [candidate division Zixibacteria bacterium]|nr:2-oxoacid:acceptor oxidoreductase family protein [candidate division Zixibacteria bacterium]
AGNPKAANIVILGALIGASEVLSYKVVEKTMKEKLGGKKDLLPSNIKLLREGYNLARKELGKKEKV